MNIDMSASHAMRSWSWGSCTTSSRKPGQRTKSAMLMCGVKSWFELSNVSNCMCKESDVTHIGRIHSGMAAYVSGEG